MYIVARICLRGFWVVFAALSLEACEFITGSNGLSQSAKSNAAHEKSTTDDLANPNNPNAPLIASQAPASAYQDQKFRFKVRTNFAVAPNLTFENLPPFLQYNAISGELSGTPEVGGNFENILVRAQFGDRRETLGPFSLEVKGDPLKRDAWHLENLGQKTFSNSEGLPGADLGIKQSIANGLTGKGVKIAISDSGTEHFHEDLVANHVTELSRDYRKGTAANGWAGDSTNPRNDESVTEPSHGTAVAGVIAAVGWNGLGSRGVAPAASFGGFNFIPANQSINDAAHQITTTQYLHQISGPFDIYNQSWGSGSDTFGDSNSYSMIKTYGDEIKRQISTARGGKGPIYVRAAGNEFETAFPGWVERTFARAGDGFDSAGRFTIHGNMDIDNTLPYFVVVGGLDASAKHASYASVGSNLWISAPAGEDGFDKPATLTVDRMECAKGYSRNTFGAAQKMFISLFDQGASAQNANCNYTNRFNGTSSATPMTSGAIALLLEANPELTWRDVKYLLARSAIKVEPNFTPIRRAAESFPIKTYGTTAGTALTGATLRKTISLNDPPGYFAVDGWRNNAAGFAFHNYYGFGQINVDAAVALLKNYKSPYANKAFKETTVSKTYVTPGANPSPNDGPVIPNAGSTVNAAICGASFACLEIPVDFSEDLVVEALRLEIMIDQVGTSQRTAYPGEVGIEIVSPAGTLSKVQSVNNMLLGAQLIDAIVGVNTPAATLSQGRRNSYSFDSEFPLSGFPMLSNAFFHEEARGVWKIRLIDGLATSFTYSANTNGAHTFTDISKTGRVMGYKFTVFGHQR